MSHARKSMAHLADKFNTAAPPGYVPGAGRGVSGFSKPPPDEPPRRGAAAGGADKFGKFGAPVPDDKSSAAAGPSSVEKSGKGLAGEAGDTRELDLAETQGVEEQDLSMDSKEAGYTVEAFNMNSERQEGHFDDDFNYVWKDKKGDDDDVKDAWLTEVDGDEKETDEKVAKRRKMLESQMSNLEAPAEVADTAALRRAAAALLQPKESVAGGLKRLSAKPKPKPRQGKERREAAKAAKAAAAAGGGGGGGCGGGGEGGGEGEGESAEERAAKKAAFEQLTEAADQLLRAGDHDIYGATKEKLLEAAAKAEAEAAAAAAAAEAEASTAAAEAAGAEGGPPAGVSAAVHDAAVAGGFLPHTGGLYFNSSSQLFFDPSSSLYWPVGASDEGPYFYFDSATQEFVKYDMGAAAAGEAPVDGTAQGPGEGMGDEEGGAGGGGGSEDHGEDPGI